MNPYRFLADVVVVIHFAYVMFVIAGLLLILLGILLRWQWVRNFWFRMIHFLMIAVVAVESIMDIVCPLFAWEDELREKAGETLRQGSFIGRLAHDLFVKDISWETSRLINCLFFLLVLIVLALAPPRWPKKSPGNQ